MKTLTILTLLLAASLSAQSTPPPIEVAVLGNVEPRASSPGEVVPSHDFYDFEDKYEAGTAGLRVPAELVTRERTHLELKGRYAAFHYWFYQ